MKARIEETLWTGGERTLIMMIFFDIGEVNFSTEGAFFVATSLVSLGSQKKENLETCFGSRDVGTFVGEVTSFTSSASEFQKKERLEMGFV